MTFMNLHFGKAERLIGKGIHAQGLFKVRASSLARWDATVGDLWVPVQGTLFKNNVKTAEQTPQHSRLKCSDIRDALLTRQNEPEAVGKAPG